MKKHEVLSLLERFPDLVDSDDLIQDLYSEASCDSAATCGTGSSGTVESERTQRSDRIPATRSASGDDSGGPFSPHGR